MLVLSRRKNESVRIGKNVEVTVLDVRGDTVRLGFCGPAEIPIYRREVLLRLARRQNRQIMPTTACPVA
jgi:carbon storage regulator